MHAVYIYDTKSKFHTYQIIDIFEIMMNESLIIVMIYHVLLNRNYKKIRFQHLIEIKALLSFHKK